MDSRILFTIFLFVLIIIICVIKKENFIVANRIIAEDEMANEEYHKCMNENSELDYKTNGKYNSCYNILNNKVKNTIPGWLACCKKFVKSTCCPGCSMPIDGPELKLVVPGPKLPPTFPLVGTLPVLILVLLIGMLKSKF
jgi:hypothetical protein